jgi:hypothetical protein
MFGGLWCICRAFGAILQLGEVVVEMFLFERVVNLESDLCLRRAKRVETVQRFARMSDEAVSTPTQSS